MTLQSPFHASHFLDPSLPVETVMTPAITVPTGIGAERAREELLDSGGEDIVVVDDELRPLGVVATELVAMEWCPDWARGPEAVVSGEETDPEGWPLPTRAPSRVDELMVPIRARIAAGASIGEACALMAGARCTRAAVVAPGGRLLGLVTAGAMLSWIASAARRPTAFMASGPPPRVRV